MLAIASMPSCVRRAPSGLPEEGIASEYALKLAGRRTASGEIYRPSSLTAAHRTLSFGTCVNVFSRDSGLAVQVRVNDRGPFVARRIIDLSSAAARAIGLRGLAFVTLSHCN
jgi:rare lipoprotein A